MTPKTTLIGFTVAALIGLVAATGPAQELPTFQRVRQTGAIVVGHRDIAIPFSYYDGQHRPVGYSIDICMRIVEAIKVELGLKRVDVTFKEVSAATRIPLVANGTVDMECGATTNNATRQLQVSFATATFVSSTRFASKKSARLGSLEDLRGKRLVAVAGTDNVLQLSEISSKRQLGIIIVPAKDHTAAFHMLETDQVAAYAADDILAYGMIARSKAPADYVISTEPLSVEPYGIMLRKGDPDLKRVADGVIVKLFKSGEIHQLYGKWFLSMIPHFNVNLNVPMSDALKRVIARPTDSPNPNAYRD